jgi:hypothetical protein
VTAIYWGRDGAAAAALAEHADGVQRWPGIPDPPARPIRLILASSRERFDSLTAGRVPEWGAAAAFPGAQTVVLRLAGDSRRVLRHELAHLALNDVVRRAPRWFDEGYAVRAAGEWDRLDALRVNWIVLRGRTPTLPQIDRYLRDRTAGNAEAAYALAGTAVLYLERMGGDRGLGPLIAALGETADFDRALRTTYGISLGQFEDLWTKDLRNRYGWLLLIGSFSAFWSVAGALLVVLWVWRRRRDRGRRAALDEGWVVHQDPWDTSA